MNELPVPTSLEIDLRAYDREIGAEAAFALNGLHTLWVSQMSKVQRRDARVVIARLEETADRHIGRRAENDHLFVGTGVKEIPPPTLEPYSKSRADALLTETQHETRTANIARLQNNIRDIAEPVYTGFLDKVPPAPEKMSRWRRNKPSSPVTWSEQGPLDPTLNHHYSLVPLKESIGFSEISCRNMTHESYANGVTAILNVANAHPTRLSLAWQLHMDYGNELEMIDKIAPGLLGQCNELGVKEWSSANRITVTFDKPTLTLSTATFTSVVEPETITYVYDPDADCFTTNRANLPSIPPATYLEVARQIFGFMPTIRVQ